MAHRVTAPALQRAQRLLQQWVRPQVATNRLEFEVQATEEVFEPIAFDRARSMNLSPFTVSTPWGRPWHTVWFKMTARVPESHAGRNLVADIDLGFSGRGDGFQVEGMAWSDGRRLHAVQPDRRMVALGRRTAGEDIELWVEASATPIIAGHAFGYGPTPLGDPATAGAGPLYSLRRADLAVHNPATAELAGILQSMIDLVIDLDDSAPQRARLFDVLDRVTDVVDLHDIESTARAALQLVRSRLESHASASSHTIVATGHAHLDTAWLWPIRETRRKAVRTFANAVDLLRSNPDAVFCHSQAQHYEWVSHEAPEIFAEVHKSVESGQWEVVGGMWVETDLNLPSGESLIRQFLVGQRAFEGWFGRRCDGAFLPDDFGYPGSLPQIVRHCGGEWFFSQKMSWNETNRFPHHSFWWEGIDGSRVFTHFSPIETYNALLTPSQLRFAERNFSDHAGASTSLALFGHGDGGGGPTQQMIDRVRTSAWWSDVPSVRFGRVQDFFADARLEYGSAAPVWVGEMYLEKHRGTYSSQITTKQGNRRCERLLHEWEVLAASRWTGSITDGEDLDRRSAAWKRVLTQQFHDIIPGSSIAWVHADARNEHAEVAHQANVAIDAILESPSVETEVAAVTSTQSTRDATVFNPAPVERCNVEWVAGRPVWVEASALSSARINLDGDAPVGVMPVMLTGGNGIGLDNGRIGVVIAADGSISHLEDPRSGRSVLLAGAAARLQVRRDRPAEYDAWDIDRADADSASIDVVAATSPTIEFQSPLGVVVRSDYELGDSRFSLTTTMNAGEAMLHFRLNAEWKESETRLQFTLPVDLLAREAACGIQFGHVRRARHDNTSWDAARFEVCAHRYVHVSEPGCGVALMADGPRGYDVRGDSLRVTLLRSPSFPDPTSDRGVQVVEWSIRLDDGPGDMGSTERIAARQAHPLRWIERPIVVEPPVSVDMPGVLISAIKMADDGSGDVIVRLWETRGSRASGRVDIGARESAHLSNGLEDRLDPMQVTRDARGRNGLAVALRPFQILTLRVR